MYLAEIGNDNANVATWRDGTWVVTMIMTTVGFGDFYPVSNAGRVVSWGVFILGALELGSLIGIAHSAIGSDKDVQNRELRTMLSEVMRKLESMETHLNISTGVGTDSHNLDRVFRQFSYSSNKLRDGYLTTGKDSTGIYMMSVDAFDRETDQEVHRWLPATSRDNLDYMLKRYLENDNEL